MPTTTTLEKRARQVLEEPFWISELKTDLWYERLHDDDDGTKEGKVLVMFIENGDGFITTDKHRGPSLRFRTMGGGGNSLRVRNALMLLALAIKLDNETRPTG